MQKLLLALAALAAAIYLFGGSPSTTSGFTSSPGTGGSGYTRLGNTGRSVGSGAVSAATRIGN